ncbi:bifunctional heptose 7-phosphate kinase/heptose 1-phosphate adenyltransferase [Natronospora cellulosivora (SeqCode)]
MSKLAKYLSMFEKQKILVLGDMIADEFIIGQPQRLSREAPVLILEQTEHKVQPGGGTNAANNVAAMGGKVILAGVIGNDSAGSRLSKKLKALGVDAEGLVVDSTRPTSVKTRILAGGGQVVKQQMVRVDNLERKAINSGIERKLIIFVEKVIQEIDALILSDYGNGVFTDTLINKVLSLANKYKKILAVDSRYQLEKFKSISIATPNKEETEKSVGFKLDSPLKVEKAGWKLKKLLDADSILITLGGEGMQLFSDEGTTHVPASNYTEVFDVTGAGDTVIATYILALSSGASQIEAMKIANYAAGIVVKKSGVATTSIKELEAVLGGE